MIVFKHVKRWQSVWRACFHWLISWRIQHSSILKTEIIMVHWKVSPILHKWLLQPCWMSWLLSFLRRVILLAKKYVTPWGQQRLYQTGSIPETVCQPTVKPKVSSRKESSYWKKVFHLGGLHNTTKEPSTCDMEFVLYLQ